MEITKEQRIERLKLKDVGMACTKPYSGVDLETQRNEFISIITYEESLYGPENVKISYWIDDNGLFNVNFTYHENSGNKDYSDLIEAHSKWFDSHIEN